MMMTSSAPPVTIKDDDESISGQSQQSNGSTTSKAKSGASSASGAPSSEEKNIQDQEGFAARETKAVHRLRLLMILVLLAMAVVAASMIYLFSRNSEKGEFENEFGSAGAKVLAGFQDDFLRKLQAMDSLSKSVASFARNTNATWPYVTVPDTAELFQPYLDLTHAAALTIMPFVPSRERADWESYSVSEQGWIDRALAQRKEMSNAVIEEGDGDELTSQDRKSISRFIHNYVGLDTSTGPWTVWHQYAPVITNRYFINFNRQTMQDFKYELDAIMRKKAVFSKAFTYVPGLDFQSTRDFSFMNELLYAGENGSYESGEPIGYMYYPIFENVDYDLEKDVPVGLVMATVYWKSFFEGTLSDNIKGIFCVVENTLGQKFTYKVSGGEAVFLGMEDLHDTSYDQYEVAANHDDFVKGSVYHGVPVDDEHVSYSIRVYPSAELEGEYMTEGPIVYACCVFVVFLVAVMTFILYDCYVERRQRILYTTAVKSTAVVSSLFPESVTKRLMSEIGAGVENNGGKNGKMAFLNKPDTSFDPKSQPIADFFPETTIMFADMVGFTAWSSSRDPNQVFTLLETIYNAFDNIAKRRRVFKVETVGDCYVAVAGLPTPRKDHAVAMCKFAQDCLIKMAEVCCELEKTLGPDTGDLNLRLGLHSGPVTAGVLRGDKGRFQLFGDAMNTASRMESTSKPGRIQLSQDTRDQLVLAGKEKWVTERQEQVIAKGLGAVRTYWFRVHAESTVSGYSVGSGSTEDSTEKKMALLRSRTLPERSQRLVQWNVELLLKQLKLVVARRQTCVSIRQSTSGKTKVSTASCVRIETAAERHGGTVLDEVQDVLALPQFDASVYENHVDPDSVVIPEEVYAQLFDFVSKIASMYRDNPFHCYEHASHVTMSVSKLLSRIVHPGQVTSASHDAPDKEIAKDLHDHTFGITSDPLTHFACVLAALIHDVDHRGVTNMALVQENDPLALKYKGKSVAEQNSMDLSWDLFMSPEYVELRSYLCPTKDEMARLRQILVNVVMATDIMDRELGQMRKSRWEKAFKNGSDNGSSTASGSDDDVNRKASIVLEHLIQASDVSHTMQHFTVFRKWNEKLFCEMYQAYLAGRLAKDPTESWYTGELGFFDYYIIPLAKKLETCGVFGVSSLEYLSYAEANRREWQEKGEEIVKDYVARFLQKQKTQIADVPESDEIDI